MKLRIHSAETDEEVFLKLVPCSSGISVVIVNGLGHTMEHGRLLTIQNDGQLYRDPGINSRLWPNLNSGGRLTVVNP